MQRRCHITIHSSQRKLKLCGWPQKNSANAYCSSLCLKKFLFLYKFFSKVEDEKVEFLGLKGYKNGPFFNAVYGDYTHNKDEFIQFSSSETPPNFA